MKLDDNNLLAALNFDTLDAAEKLTGKSYKEDDGVTLLGLALMQQKSKVLTAELSARGDSHFSITLTEFFDVLQAEGFERCLEIPITPKVGETAGDKFFIYFKPSEGLLLKFDTYSGGTVINGGDVLYNWKPADAVNRWSVTSSGGYFETPDGLIHEGSRDCREGIRFHLQRMREAGTFLPKWKKSPFLWLLHYGDTRSKDYDYKAITGERVAMLPAHVREAIQPE